MESYNCKGILTCKSHISVVTVAGGDVTTLPPPVRMGATKADLFQVHDMFFVVSVESGDVTTLKL